MREICSEERRKEGTVFGPQHRLRYHFSPGAAQVLLQHLIFITLSPSHPWAPGKWLRGGTWAIPESYRGPLALQSLPIWIPHTHLFLPVVALLWAVGWHEISTVIYKGKAEIWSQDFLQSSGLVQKLDILTHGQKQTKARQKASSASTKIYHVHLSQEVHPPSARATWYSVFTSLIGPEGFIIVPPVKKGKKWDLPLLAL